MSHAKLPNSIGSESTGGTRPPRRRAAAGLSNEAPNFACDERPDDAAEKTSIRPPSGWARPRKPVATVTIGDPRPSPSGVSSEDPLRSYLADVGSIALLSRDQERAVAEAVESNRLLFRRSLLVNEFVLRAVVEQLTDVEHRRQRPEHVIDVAVAGSVKKTRIMNRLAPNLKTLAALLKQNGEDFRLAMCFVSPENESGKSKLARCENYVNRINPRCCWDSSIKQIAESACAIMGGLSFC